MRAAGDRAPRSAAAIVGEIMTVAPRCVAPTLPVAALTALLLEHNLSGVPVVDAAGKPVGVVSKTDLVRHCQAPEGATVADIMMPMVFAIAHDVTIAQAAALMAGEGVHRLPVVDDRGAVCGILSALDIVRWVAAEAGYAV